MKYPLAFRMLMVISILQLCASQLMALQIIEVTPVSQSLNAPNKTEITLACDAALDPSTVNSGTIHIFGHWSGVADGIFSLEENNTRIRFIPSSLFNAGEWVMISISTNLRSAQGDPLEYGYCWQFWIKPAPGNLDFIEVDRISVRQVGENHIQTYGAHGADLNDDGYSDFFVPNEITNDCRVFLNDGTGHYHNFSVYPIRNGARPSTNESADFNMDGHIDVAVGNSTGDSITVFLGDGTGSFLSIENYRAASGIRGLAVSDMDGDGDMDIVTANRSGNNVTVLHNNGDGTFGARMILDGLSSGETACATADANGDGILDLFVGAHGSGEVSLMLGDGLGSFVFRDKTASGGNGSWMIAVGDINKDGHVDAAIVNSQSGNVGVIFTDGEGNLSEAVTYATGGFPIAIDLGDVDGDEDLDLMTSNFSGATWTLWENDGNGQFINRRNFDASRAGSCATFHDRDNDGDLDMTGIDELDDLIFLFENTGTSSVIHAFPSQQLLRPISPNPLSEKTVISFSVPDAFGNAHVSLRILDTSGRIVETLFHQKAPQGMYSITLDPGPLAAGTYLCQLQVAAHAEVCEFIVN